MSKRASTTQYTAPAAGAARGLLWRLGASLVSLLACIAVLGASTFALFHDQVAAVPSTLTGAYYTLTAKDPADDSVVTKQTMDLAPGDAHEYTLIASGTASTGYCIVTVTDADGTATNYPTDPIAPNASLNLTVIAASGCTITFTPCWGASTKTATLALTEEPAENTQVITHSATPSVEITVQEGMTLAQIAEHYGVSEGDILLYNGITELTVGEAIRIPHPATEDPMDEPTPEEEDSGDNEEDTDPPADGDTTPPADGDATPPADEDTTPPADGDTTPPADEDTTPPADDTTPPADDTTPPAEDTTPPAEDTTPTDGGDETPGAEDGEDGENDDPTPVPEIPSVIE